MSRASECAFDFRRQRRYTRNARGVTGALEGSTRRLRPEATHRDARNHQLVDSPQRGWEGQGVELGERTLGLVDAADQEEAPYLEIPGVCGVDAVAMCFQRRPRRVERVCRPAEVP